MMLRLALVMGLVPILISAQRWGNQYCENGKLPIVLLHRNTSSGEFTVVERIPINDTEFDKGAFRHLEKDMLVKKRMLQLRSEWVPGLLLGENRLLENDFVLDNQITGTANNAPDDKDKTASTISPDLQDKDVPSADDDYFYARECSCFSDFPTVYCPFVADICQQPDTDSTNSDQKLPGCLTLVENEKQSRILIYLTVAGFWIIGGLCLFTKQGGSALGYLIACCFPGRNRRILDRMIQEDPIRITSLLQSFSRRRYQRMEQLALETSHQTAWMEEQLRQQQRQDLEQAGVTSFDIATSPQDPAVTNSHVSNPSLGERIAHADDPLQPVSFALRTRTFRKNPASFGSAENDLGHDDTGDDFSCSICFDPLVNGERVGALPCDHIFHVECLKMWVQRRNVCPLCQMREIATPMFAHDDLNCAKITDTVDEESSTDFSSGERSIPERQNRTDTSHEESSDPNVT